MAISPSPKYLARERLVDDARCRVKCTFHHEIGDASAVFDVLQRRWRECEFYLGEQEAGNRLRSGMISDDRADMAADWC